MYGSLLASAGLAFAVLSACTSIATGLARLDPACLDLLLKLCNLG